MTVRILRGAPTPEELAALVALLTRLPGPPPTPSPPTPVVPPPLGPAPPVPTTAWNSPGTQGF